MTKSMMRDKNESILLEWPKLSGYLDLQLGWKQFFSEEIDVWWIGKLRWKVWNRLILYIINLFRNEF